MDAPALPGLDELRGSARVVSLPLRVRFRGIEHREALLIEGPHGWGEFAPFPEYADDEAATWLSAAIAAAWQPPPSALRSAIPVNATIPAVPAADVPAVLARFPGAATAKVKVAERGQVLADDLARVAAVRELVPTVRIDANGAWTVEEATAAIEQFGGLEYAEQPCRTVEELATLRGRVDVPIAADESIRRASDPLRVARLRAADIAVIKVSPLGGPARVLGIAEQLAAAGMRVVVSSAIDTAVGIGTGLATAAALPELPHACGLATSRLLLDDVAEPPAWNAGTMRAERPVPEPAALQRLAATPERQQWWLERLDRCHRILAERPAAAV
ncbi:o-succinylbenzoate synthase [Hoyosella sp. G463]|uniref:o-succinylbenzoate synthase n=1 Tax=Lolliginicoccus lacisalsi TaxID=2742202 RepID=A0A927JDY3_9ACTN|nr:o-succinylbenzoate synthase [Lolliginicoccus lacisalsi]MBD8507343.1 o-succinylbenzoate synthase [Lolliginicoccus lacisalsi]